MRKTKSYKFLLKHSQELSENYPGKYLAIIDNEVVAVSNSGHDAFENHRQLQQAQRPPRRSPLHVHCRGSSGQIFCRALRQHTRGK